MKIYYEFCKIENKYLIKNDKNTLVICDNKLSLFDLFNLLFKDYVLPNEPLDIEVINKTNDDTSTTLYEKVSSLLHEVTEIINEIKQGGAIKT